MSRLLEPKISHAGDFRSNATVHVANSALFIPKIAMGQPVKRAVGSSESTRHDISPYFMYSSMFLIANNTRNNTVRRPALIPCP